jgi:F-BAR domain only protein
MKEFIMLYIDIVQNNHDLVGQVSEISLFSFSQFHIMMFHQQVHTDFKRQFLDLTVDKLLEQFVLNKYTGLEKPGEFK